MSVPVLEGITARTVVSPRLSTRVLFSGPEDGTPVLFIHGNASSATYWEEVMLALPAGYRGIAPDLRGYGEADPAKKIDATRGAGDWADDAIALLDTLGLDRVHLAGHSMGGGVIWRLIMDHAPRLRSVTVVNPNSPYGFGGTKGIEGMPCYPDCAGSGGGVVNAEFPQADGRRGSRHGQPPGFAARGDEQLLLEATLHPGPRRGPA